MLQVNFPIFENNQMILSEFQQKLYDNLIQLSNDTEMFFHIDHEFNTDFGIHYFRVFSYRLARYSDWLINDSTFESRGIMFEMRGGVPFRIASMPMFKYFNAFENLFTENLDFKNPKQIMVKEDGSLISSFTCNGELFLKSKTSLSSDQAIDSLNWLRGNEKLYSEIYDLTMLGYTVNMEWTSLKNRIILGYDTENLVILNVRNIYTGEYVDRTELTEYPNILDSFVRDITDEVEDVEVFVENIYNMAGIEGFVLVLNDGTWVKLKTSWYLNLHKNKEAISSPKKLFETIIYEYIDDIRVLFKDDLVVLKVISDMEELIEPKFNHMITTVELFYYKNKNLSRKEYAIKAQKLNDGFMCLYMNQYLNKPCDYKVFAVKNVERFINE